MISSYARVISIPLYLRLENRGRSGMSFSLIASGGLQIAWRLYVHPPHAVNAPEAPVVGYVDQSALPPHERARQHSPLLVLARPDQEHSQRLELDGTVR